MCFLQCTVGNAFPRVRLSNVLRSRDVEPASVNIGCDDVSNMRCRGTIFELLYARLPTSFVLVFHMQRKYALKPRKINNS